MNIQRALVLATAVLALSACVAGPYDNGQYGYNNAHQHRQGAYQQQYYGAGPGQYYPAQYGAGQPYYYEGSQGRY